MSKNVIKSCEEKVEDLFKKQLDKYGVKYYTKNESVNKVIDIALKEAPSKNGKDGGNFVDIRVLLETKSGTIPVMIEAKGTQGDLVKYDSRGGVDLSKQSIIKKYAVNGAVHYVNCIKDRTTEYKEYIAIGINGYEEEDKLKTEMSVWYISKNNFDMSKEVKGYNDLSFLSDKNKNKFVEELRNIALSKEEKEEITKKTENDLDVKLRKINQIMQDTLTINVSHRVNLISGMIMAGLGVEDEKGNWKVKPLEVEALEGGKTSEENDGKTLTNKIRAFLNEKNLPKEKYEMIINIFSNVFERESSLYIPKNGESKLKSIYRMIYSDIIPIFRSSHHLDFTGKLFNVLNEWVSVPDGDKNDVVLTPRYVTDLMAKLGKVNKDSYVWDYCTGSAGFLVSSMKLMLEDAKNKIKDSDELRKKDIQIKTEQLLGIEKLSDIYMLAVLNMILMGDGSSNILHKDSLTYDGKYEQGKLKDEDFPANVFLLNPPYSREGKGFIFVEKALEKMKEGRAVILIQENAGSGQGLPYTKRILEKNSLIASIKMADIFCGKAGVQTAIYVFEVGKAHDPEKEVKFINFTNDGYARQNRKKSSQDVNLKDVDNAVGRYQEVIDLVEYGKKKLNLLKEEDYIEDTISLEGNDWTFSQHQKIDTMPTEEDFKKVVADYLSWKVSAIIKGEIEI